MKTFLISLIAIFILAQHHAVADTSESAAREQAATELIDLMGLEEQMLGGATAMVDAMSSQSPELRQYRDVIIEWAESIMTWETFGPQLTQIYAEAFTENELRDLIAFYQTPTGQKTLSLMPELTQKGAQLGVTEAQAHIPRLQQMIQARKAELEADDTGD